MSIPSNPESADPAFGSEDLAGETTHSSAESAEAAASPAATPAPSDAPTWHYAGLQEGRMVHLVDENGRCRPAVVDTVWHTPSGGYEPDGLVNLTWFVGGAHAATMVPYADYAEHAPVRRSWHWFGNQAGSTHREQA